MIRMFAAPLATSSLLAGLCPSAAVARVLDART
jgi:hypothetical protein